jgi:hypothetical protein
MRSVKMHEAKANLSKLINQACHGEDDRYRPRYDSGGSSCSGRKGSWAAEARSVAW